MSLRGLFAFQKGITSFLILCASVGHGDKNSVYKIPIMRKTGCPLTYITIFAERKAKGITDTFFPYVFGGSCAWISHRINIILPLLQETWETSRKEG